MTKNLKMLQEITPEWVSVTLANATTAALSTVVWMTEAEHVLKLFASAAQIAVAAVSVCWIRARIANAKMEGEAKRLQIAKLEADAALRQCELAAGDN